MSFFRKSFISTAIFAATCNAFAGNIENYAGDLPKTSNRVIAQVPSAYLYGVKGVRDYTLVYNSCDFIIQNYYDQVDACSREPDCYPSSIPFPSTTQPVFQIYDGYYSGIAQSVIANDEGVSPVREFYGQCKFEPRTGYSSRTEKGWTKVGFNPANSQWDDTKGRFLMEPAQSVVTASEGMAMTNPSLGIARCGYDGLSNVSGADYRQNGYIKASNNITSGISWTEQLDYIVAGKSLRNNLGLYSTTRTLNVKDIFTSGLKGELDPSTPMIVGECNSSCTDPSFEVYSIPSSISNLSNKLTGGLASQQNSWAIKKITQSSPKNIMPDAVLFKNETVSPPPPTNQYGQKVVQTDMVLPGGALFGYTSQFFWVR